MQIKINSCLLSFVLNSEKNIKKTIKNDLRHCQIFHVNYSNHSIVNKLSSLLKLLVHLLFACKFDKHLSNFLFKSMKIDCCKVELFICLFDLLIPYVYFIQISQNWQIHSTTFSKQLWCFNNIKTLIYFWAKNNKQLCLKVILTHSVYNRFLISIK